MADDLLSIVVPVYNVRNYVDECLSSILSQTYQNLEIIIVLDAPTDGSDEICRRYAERDKRVKLIVFEENKGLFRARASGFEAASGRYVGSVDADDYIDRDMYQNLMDCRADFDLVISRWKREEENETKEAFDLLAPGPYRTKEDMDFIAEHLIDISVPGGGEHIQSGIAPFVWNKLYKTDLARKIYRSIKGNVAVSEDLVFTSQYILACSSILITEICGYHYRIRKASGSHASNIDRSTADARDVYKNLEPVFMAHPRREALMPQLQRKVARLLNRAPSKMGFCAQARNQTIVFPFLNLLDGRRVALYGAGLIGQSYWLQIRKFEMCEIDIWVDEDWEYYRREGRNVHPVESLLTGGWEYVVVASFHKDTADKARKRLRALGIEDGQVLWKNPFIF